MIKFVLNNNKCEPKPEIFVCSKFDLITKYENFILLYQMFLVLKKKKRGL